MAIREICGCFYNTSTEYYSLTRHYLPQVALSSHTKLYSIAFTTTLTQTFFNSTSDVIKEARYVFPLYDGVAVTAFTCTIGDRTITGHVEQKEDARQTFEAAVERGESAGLLESLPLGVFATTLGNIPANASIIVNVTYGGELKHDAEIDGLRYTLPTSIAPRYGEYPGELLQPNSAISSRGMRITVDADMKDSAIRKIQSPSKEHPISVSIGNTSGESSQATPQASKASISLALGTAELSTDFVLQILVDNIGSPKAILEKHPTLPSQALMTTFVPRFNMKASSPEIVFVADQSGSMQGSRNKSLVAALTTFLKSLPMGVRFNICPFGFDHEFLWESSQPYTKDNVATALAFVQSFDASYGGTEMFPAVEATFEKRLGDMPLEVILLTDGQIYEEGRLFDLINRKLKDEKVDARVFTLGIGNEVSTTLVEGVSRAGNGFSQFVRDDELMDQKVVRMLKSALYPHFSNFSLEVEYAEPEDDFEMVDDDVANPEGRKDARGADGEQKPSGSTEDLGTKEPISMFDESSELDTPVNRNPDDRYAHLPVLPLPKILQHPGADLALFPFNRTTAYLLLETGSSQTPVSVKLRAQSPQGALELKIPVHVAEEGSSTIHHLAVRKLVHELEEGRGWVMDATLEGKPVKQNSRSSEIAEREAVRLGLKYQVANKWCSFVAVEDGNSKGDHVAAEREGGPLNQPYNHNPFPRSYRAGGGAKRCRRTFAAGSLSPPAPQPTGAPAPPGGSALFASSSFSPAAPQPTGVSALFCKRASPSPAPRAAPAPFQPYLTSQPAHMMSNQFYPPPIPAAAAAPPPLADVDRVRGLIALQEFSGCWQWDSAVFALLELDIESVGPTVERDAVTATATVLRFLTGRMAAFEGVWEMVVEKARAWLERETTIEQRKGLDRLAETLLPANGSE